MALNAAQVKARIGDELGLTDEDLARLYGVDAGKLDKHLASLEKDANAVYQRILSDVDGVRTGYRMLQVSDAHIAAVRELLKDYIFHPLVSTAMADGHVGWKLGSDDAQFVAFRVADIVGMDHDWSEVLRLRLKRLIVWPNENMPQTNREFRDRVADITFYLVELTGVL
jgi:hypothetical protein